MTIEIQASPLTAEIAVARLRLLFVLPDLDEGEAQRDTLLLLKGLAEGFGRRRYELTLLVLDGPGALSDQVPSAVRIVYPPRSRLLHVGKLAALRHGLNHDVLIASMEVRASYCVHFAATTLRKPSVAWIRIALGERSAEISDKNRRKSKQIYGDFDRLVCASDSVRQSFENWFGEHRDQWCTIPDPAGVGPNDQGRVLRQWDALLNELYETASA
jgi:hypothetical protein